jgi:hypothetical protein
VDTRIQEPKKHEPKKFQAINLKVFENNRHFKFEFLLSFFASWRLGSWFLDFTQQTLIFAPPSN